MFAYRNSKTVGTPPDQTETPPGHPPHELSAPDGATSRSRKAPLHRDMARCVI